MDSAGYEGIHFGTFPASQMPTVARRDAGVTVVLIARGEGRGSLVLRFR